MMVVVNFKEEHGFAIFRTLSRVIAERGYDGAAPFVEAKEKRTGFLGNSPEKEFV